MRPRAGADGGADGDLPLAAGSAHEQQARHVGAGDQQHEADRPEQHQQQRPGVPDQRVADRLHREGGVLGDHVGEPLPVPLGGVLQHGTRPGQ